MKKENEKLTSEAVIQNTCHIKKERRENYGNRKI